LSGWPGTEKRVNKQRRKAIAEAQDQIQQALGMIEAAKETVEALRDEEQDYFEAMPESIQQSEKGEAAQEALAAFEAAIEALDEMITSEVDEHLSEAAA
jgi:hypothetical protein